MRAVKSEIVAIRVLIRGEIDNKVVCVKTAIRSAKAVRSLGERQNPSQVTCKRFISTHFGHVLLLSIPTTVSLDLFDVSQ